MTCSPPRQGAQLSWNSALTLRCVSCSQVVSPGPEYSGCGGCGAPLVTSYSAPSLPAGDPVSAVEALRTHHLPISVDQLVNLGQQATPLVAAGDGALLKLEAQNPTGSHKDRFHAVAAAIALGLGHHSVVTASTGNHGLACSAFSAAAGLGSLVLLHPEAPASVATQIASHGAHLAVLPGAIRETVIALVDDGWCPATSADPALAGRANPYGSDGYRAIAYEIVQQVGHVPAIVAVPAASGDTFYGVWRGFRDMHEILDLPMPRLLACQPAGAAPLALTESLSASEPQEVADPVSAALSARDPRSGWHATVALRSDGQPIMVPEELLVHTLASLAHRGHSFEPAAALAVAGLNVARSTGACDPDVEAVAIVTSSGANWTEHLQPVFGPPVVHRDGEDLAQALAERSGSAA